MIDFLTKVINVKQAIIIIFYKSKIPNFNDLNCPRVSKI